MEQAYEVERTKLLEQKGFNESRSYDAGAPEDQPLTGDLDAYIHRLRTFVNEFFDGNSFKVPLLAMLQRLEHHIPPPLYPDQPMSHTIYSTNPGGFDQVPPIFLSWKDMLGEDGWKIEVAGDDLLEYWFGNLTRGTGSGTERFRSWWTGIHKPVLKSDFLRYVKE